VRSVVLCVVIFAAFAAAVNKVPIQQIDDEHAGLRLIEFNETRRQWMTEEEVLKMIVEGKKCGKHGGWMDVTDHQELSAKNNKVGDRLRQVQYPNPSHQDYVNNLIPKLSADELRLSNNNLSSHFTRYYTSDTGVDAARWIEQTFDSFASDHNAVDVSLFPHTWKQPSVIARFHGNGPNADEIVIIGAHEDSINGPAGIRRAPGADDDGSGTSVVLEVFRVLAQNGFQPSRTVEFQTYSAEEVGLRGSQAIANQYQDDGKVVVAMMQLDMAFYPGRQAGQQRYVGIITDYVNDDLTAFVRKLVETYATIPWTNTDCGYACSDHASWDKAGYPASFPFEAAFGDDNPYIHSADDTIDKLDLNHGLQFARVALGFAVELGLDNSTSILF